MIAPSILQWKILSVLQVKNLQVSYYTDAGRARALDGVDLTLCAGEKLGLGW